MFHSVWKKQGWAQPQWKEEFEPDRTTLTLEIDSDKKTAIKKEGAATRRHKEEIWNYLAEHGEATCAELAQQAGLKPARVREILAGMQEEGYSLRGETAAEHID